MQTSKKVLEEKSDVIIFLRMASLFVKKYLKLFSFSKQPAYRNFKIYKELNDCLTNVAHYSGIVVKIEKFIAQTFKDPNKSNQTYDAFIECLIEFLKFYKTKLNHLAVILEKKGIYILFLFFNQIQI